MLCRHCNCDAGDDELRVDAGIFKLKKDLPVKEVNFDLGESGTVTVGNLYCADIELSKWLVV